MHILEQARTNIFALKQEESVLSKNIEIINSKIGKIENLIFNLNIAIIKTQNKKCDFLESDKNNQLGILSLQTRTNPSYANAERLAIVTDFIPKEIATVEHLMGVATISEYLYRKYTSDSAENAIELAFASMLHDCGKTMLSIELLQHRAKYKDHEEETMKKHTEHGYYFLRGSPSTLMNLAAQIALTHHERWNGTGYPNQLSGDRIPLGGQIVAIADSVDAMTQAGFFNKEPRAAKTPHEIKSFLLTAQGVLYSPKLVEIMLENFNEIMDLHDTSTSVASQVSSKLVQV